MCRGQGYDGAGNMAGCCNGAAKIISTKYVINLVHFFFAHTEMYSVSITREK